MSWFIVATAVATFYTSHQQKEAGKQQQYNLERQAEQKRIAAEGQELQRRERLNQVLSANIQSLSSAGILSEGSPQSVSLESAKQASQSEAAESLSDKMRQDLLKREGKAAAKLGKTQATSTLLSGAARVAQLRQ